MISWKFSKTKSHHILLIRRTKELHLPFPAQRVFFKFLKILQEKKKKSRLFPPNEKLLNISQPSKEDRCNPHPSPQGSKRTTPTGNPSV